MTQERNAYGEFVGKPAGKPSKSSKWGNRIFIFVIIAFFIFVAYQYKVSLSSDIQTPETTEQVKVENTGSKIDEVMNEVDFKKKMELEAKKIVSEREKKAELARHDAEVKAEKEKHDAKIAEIEKELEAVRAEELSFFQQAPAQKDSSKQ